MSAWQRQLTVPQFTVVSGLLVIALGTLLLATPLCSGPSVDLWEALFTATSAITVTGLSIIDVGTELTFFGQLVLAALIITGGLGLMAISTFLQALCKAARVCVSASTRAAPSINSVWAEWAPPSGPS